MESIDLERVLARADLCRFLAACYYEPGPEFRDEGLFDAMRAVATRIDPELAASVARLAEAFGADDAQALLIDYTRLFLGPTGTLASPYESVWRTGRPAHETAASVTALYRDGGFELSGDFHDLPDHVAAELEFHYLMLHRECEGRHDGDAQRSDRSAELRKRMLREHLAAWVPAFSQAVASGAGTGFYRELAALTAAVVAREAREP